MSEQIATPQSKAITPYEGVRIYIRSEAIMQRFVEILGKNAPAYLSSVLIAVANDENLQKCTPKSIVTSAMKAATLHLSCDPTIGQAFIVPFKDVATLVVGYKGLRDMAIRTGKYRFLHVARIQEGQQVIEDQLRGEHTIQGFPSKRDAPVVGYLLYFELTNGYTKTFYMETDEIIEHAKRYSRSYDNPKGKWKTETDKMCAKTVLRLGLTHWGYIDPYDAMILNQYDETANGEGMMDDIVIDQPEQEKHTEAENLRDLGYEVDPETGEIKGTPPMPDELLAKTAAPTSTGSLEAWKMSSDKNHTPYDTMTPEEQRTHLNGLLSNADKAKTTDPALDEKKIAYLKKLLGVQ